MTTYTPNSSTRKPQTSVTNGYSRHIAAQCPDPLPPQLHPCHSLPAAANILVTGAETGTGGPSMRLLVPARPSLRTCAMTFWYSQTHGMAHFPCLQVSLLQ
jgi:hypothetical protein